MDPLKKVKHEIDSDFHIDMKIEDHPIVTETKSEIYSRGYDQEGMIGKIVPDCINPEIIFLNTKGTGLDAESFQDVKIEEHDIGIIECNVIGNKKLKQNELHREEHFVNKNKCVNTHHKKHTTENQFGCDQCEKRFNQSDKLVAHLRFHKVVKHVCILCDKSFSQRGSLVKHLKYHNIEKNYFCNQCKKDFRHRGALVAHMRIHTGEKPYSCDQ
ncbi:unnamed protein product, partial [Meganyctiphanes norvegica]